MIIVISNPAPLKDEISILCQLFDNGLDCFHLRKKTYTEAMLKSYIKEIPEEFYNRIVLHSHYQLAAEYNLKGIHIPCSFKGQGINNTLSVSFHSVDEIQSFGTGFSYGFLSPLFDSISKEGYKSNFDFSVVKEFLTHCNEKIIALGGIDEDKLKIVKDMGFSGIALLGAIWQNDQPVEKFKHIKEQWKK